MVALTLLPSIPTGFFVGDFRVLVGVNESDVTNNTESPPGPSASSGGGGGGGGGGGTVIAAPSFEVTPEIIVETLRQGMGRSLPITVTNLRSNPLTVRISLSNLSDVAVLHQEEIEIAPNASYAFFMDIFATLDTRPGTYMGKLIIDDPSGADKVIGVVINVRERTSLFDIVVSVPAAYESVAPGATLLVQVNLENIGLRGDPIDVPLTLTVIDPDGNEIIESIKKTIAVSTSYNTVEEMSIPKDAPEGLYIVKGAITYGNNVSVEAYDIFEVDGSFFAHNQSMILATAILGTVLVSIVGAGAWFFRLQHMQIQRIEKLERKTSVSDRVLASELRQYPKIMRHNQAIARGIHPARAFVLVMFAALMILVLARLYGAPFTGQAITELSPDVTLDLPWNLIILSVVAFAPGLLIFIYAIRNRSIFSTHLAIFFFFMSAQSIARFFALAYPDPSLYFVHRIFLAGSSVFVLLALDSIGLKAISRLKIPIVFAVATVIFAFIDAYLLGGILGDYEHPFLTMLTSQLVASLGLVLAAYGFARYGGRLSPWGRWTLVGGFILGAIIAETRSLLTYYGFASKVPLLVAVIAVAIAIGWVACAFASEKDNASS
jgi:hypothetical protein